MKTKLTQDYLNMIEGIMEGGKAYLEKDMTAGLVAQRLGIKKRKLEIVVSATFGLSLDILIDMFRVVHARALLKNGVCYEELWKVSGFKSLECMESAFECIVV